MKVLYFDCFSGISGDMVLGALLDAGLPIEDLRRALGSLTIGGYDIAAEKVSRAGVAATKFRVIEHDRHHHDGPHHHDHHGDHHHHGHDQPHRTLADIVALVDRSALSSAAKERAKGLFARLAEAEAAIHQVPIDEIHFHEVGALDSIVDIVGAVHGLEWVGADEIVCSPLNVGGGVVDTAHGRFPVPAPATLRLLQGAPVYSSGQQAELVTPTGALLATSSAQRFGSMPAMTVERIGYGAGDRNPDSTPNVLRVVVGETAADLRGERVVVLEFEVDDMNPQLFGPLMDHLYAAGALEVFYAPVQMKKNRPGTLVTVVCRPRDRDAMSGIVFRDTTTIGFRYHEVQRECLDRRAETVETPLGPVRFKIASSDGRVLNAAPEFEDCARVASERGVPIKDVQAIAVKAYLDSRK